MQQEATINNIKKEYDQASAEVQALVSNYDKLVAYLTVLSNLKTAAVIINKIDAISTPITLQQEATIKSIKAEYDQAPAEIQALVSNYDTLLDYLVTLSNLKAELDAIRYNSIQSLENYLDLNLYSDANQQIICQLIAEASQSISQSLSKTEIGEIVEDYKLQLSEILSIQEELVPYKKEKLDALSNIDYTLYNEVGQATLRNIINDATALINQATSKESIDQTYADAQNQIENVKTIAQLENEFALYQEEQIEYIKQYLDQSLYSEDGITRIHIVIDQATALIHQATNKEGVDTIVSDCKMNLNSILTYNEELDIKKEEYLAKIDALVKTYDVLENVLEQISALALLGKQEIRETSLLEDIATIFEHTKENINTYLENLKNAQNEAKNNIFRIWNDLDYVEEEKTVILKIYDMYCITIDQTSTLLEIEQLQNEYQTEVETYHLELEDQRKKTNAILEDFILDTYTEGQKNYLNTLLKDTRDSIKAAGLVEKILSLQSSFEESVHAYISDMDKKIQEIINYLDTKMNSDAFITTLIAQAKESLKSKSNVQELDDVKASFDVTLQNYLQTNPNPSPDDKNCNCTSTILIYSCMFTIVMCMGIVIKKNAFR